jgi:hypothetical protein
MGTIFKDQAVYLDCLNLENGTDKLSRNVGTTNPRCIKSRKRKDLIYTAGKPVITPGCSGL